MEKIKFDFDATKERIYAPNSNVPIGAPVDRNGNIANDGNAYGIVLCKETENEKYWVRYNLVVMVAGYCDIIDAQAIWGDEYSAEAMAAMSDIVFCENHMIPGGSDPAIANAKETGGFGWTEDGGGLVTIKWEDAIGDITVNAYGANYRWVSDIVPTRDDMDGALTKSTMSSIHPVQPMTDDGEYVMFDGGSGIVVVKENNVLTPFGFQFPKAGVYFAFSEIDHTDILQYTHEAVIHKIDEKYLGGGGGMVVNFNFDEELNVTADKTFTEIDNAIPNVVGVASANGNTVIFPFVGKINMATPEEEPNYAMMFSYIDTDATGYDITGIIKQELTISPDESVTMNQYTKTFD